MLQGRMVTNISHMHGNISQGCCHHAAFIALLCVCRQVPPRHQVPSTVESSEASFALYVFCPELPSRTAVNSHIVVAGASDCGLSVIETLLLHERLHFSAVTLLAPTGVATAASDAHYTAELLTRLVSLTNGITYHEHGFTV